MLKKVEYLDGDIVRMLCSYANISISEILNNKKTNVYDLKYKDLLIIASKPENLRNKIMVKDVIDQLIFDNYSTYIDMKNRLNQMNFDDIQFNSDIEKTLFYESKKEIEKYLSSYKKTLLESKFEYASTRQIQKIAIKEEIKYNISIENYELCADLKKRLNEI